MKVAFSEGAFLARRILPISYRMRHKGYDDATGGSCIFIPKYGTAGRRHRRQQPLLKPPSLSSRRDDDWLKLVYEPLMSDAHDGHAYRARHARR